MSIFRYPLLGRYVPTRTNTTNITSSVCNSLIYFSWGAFVLVAGSIQINPTAAGACQLDLSLPFPTVFADTDGLSGNATNPGIIAGSIIPTPAGLSQASVIITAPGAGNTFWRIVFVYLIT